MQRNKLTAILCSALFALSVNVVHASITVPMYLVEDNGPGKAIGTVKLANSFCGVILTPDLHDLPPGLHGFHVHVNPSCANKGMAAGDHLDPAKTNDHLGPYSHKGHLGDLPVLMVEQNGQATIPTLAPRFKLKELQHHALVIHAGGDNYTNNPKNGGGGDRIACGVIP